MLRNKNCGASTDNAYVGLLSSVSLLPNSGCVGEGCFGMLVRGLLSNRLYPPPVQRVVHEAVLLFLEVRSVGEKALRLRLCGGCGSAERGTANMNVLGLVGCRVAQHLMQSSDSD